MSSSKYAGILGVVANAVVATSPRTLRDTTGMLETAVHVAGSVTES